MVGENVLDRFAFGAEAGGFGAKLVQLLTKFGGGAAGCGQPFFGGAAGGDYGLEFRLTPGDAFRELLFDAGEAFHFR